VNPRQPRGRGDLGGDQVEGRRAVRELLRAGRRPVRRLVLTADAAPHPLLDEILDLAATARVRVERVPAGRLEALARTEAPQGVLARTTPVAPRDVDDLLADPGAFLVAVDGITDPGNLGAVLRTAEAAGATGVVLPRHRAVRLTPAAVKAAAGAVEHLAVASVAGVPEFLVRARRRGVWSVGLDERGATTVFELPVAEAPVLLVLGAEGRGLSRLARDRCDLVARIPMRGALESLNVATAAAVACFEIARHRARDEEAHRGKGGR
jgi:23S rRNA (guanosine2251-2'-O)-methyltransferase